MVIIEKRSEKEKVNHVKTPRSFSTLKLSLLFLFTLAILIPIISAVEVEMKQNFSSGETLLAIYSGNFIDQITKDNVVFYRENVEIPMIYDVKKINNDFYLYALLTGKVQDEYSIRVENVRYMKAIQIVDDDIVTNFSITNETAMFSVNPGAVITSSGFDIELQNLQDKKITVDIIESISSINSLTSISLNTGETKTISFTAATTPANGLETVEFSSEGFSYELPVYFNTNQTGTTETDFDFEFQPGTVEVSMATDSETKRILYIKNTGEKTIEDILFRISSLLEPYVTVSPEEINSLAPGESEKIELQIISDTEEAVLEGKITAYNENVSTSFTLVLDWIKDFVPSDNETGEVIVPTCEQLSGKICASNEKCAEDTLSAKDGPCCLVQCLENKKSSNTKWIGWGLLVLVLLVIYWFYRRKYRRVYPRRPF